MKNYTNYNPIKVIIEIMQITFVLSVILGVYLYGEYYEKDYISPDEYLDISDPNEPIIRLSEKEILKAEVCEYALKSGNYHYCKYIKEKNA